MRNAMVADLAMLDDVAVTCATCTLSSDVDESLPARVQQVCRPPGIPALDFLRNQAALHDFVWVVAPESGGMLASLRAASEDRQWLGCGGRAIAIASSKRATAAALRTAGIAATEPFEAGIGLDVDPDERIASGSVASGSVASGDGAWVVKPDDGCGAAGARKHRNFDQACRDYIGRRRQGEVAVLEPWVAGESLSLSLLCGPQDVQVLSLNRQHISVDEDGFLGFDGVSIGPAPVGERGQQLEALARSIADALPGLAGFVGVDVTWHPARGPVVIEVNPRVTCAYAGLSAMGRRNVGQEVLRRHLLVHGAARERVDARGREISRVALPTR